MATKKSGKAKVEKSMPSSSNMQSKEVPVGAKVIGVLEYIGAVVMLLIALLLFVGSAFVGDILESAGIPIPGAAGTAVAIVLGVIVLAFAVLAYFLGRGLWRGQNWARIVVIIFSVLGVLGGLMSIVQGQWGGLFNIIVYGIIGGYLWFNGAVKAAFS